MPIQFPLPPRGNPFDRWFWQWGTPPSRGFAQAGTLFTRPNIVPYGIMDPGIGRPTYRTNLRELIRTYRDPKQNAVVNPARMLNPLEENTKRSPNDAPSSRSVPYQRTLGSAAWRLSGTTRDSAGSPLGSCTVKVFRTADDVLMATLVSDATTGAWSVDLMTQGPFYTVDYLAGSPDRAGTSVNTLTPTQAF